MVGLSIVLESTGQKGTVIMMRRNSQVINKSTIIINNSTPGFLEYCSLCRTKLLPANDIYMYKGDRAFCSEECRCRQIFMDEKDDDDILRGRSHLKEICGFTGSAPSSSSGSRNRGGANGSGY